MAYYGGWFIYVVVVAADCDGRQSALAWPDTRRRGISRFNFPPIKHKAFNSRTIEIVLVASIAGKLKIQWGHNQLLALIVTMSVHFAGVFVVLDCAHAAHSVY